MQISVIIPCHDAEQYLAQAVGSVLEQSHPPAEVIIVDDSSTDGSLELALRLAAADDRIRVLSHAAGNAGRTRNLGASIARFDALMFLDADDVLGPETLSSLGLALDSVPAALAICPWFRLEEVGPAWVERPASCRPRKPGEDPLAAWLTGWYHPPCSVLWSREAFERAGRWPEVFNPNDDGDLVMRALAFGVPLVQTATGAGYYRRMPEGEVSLSGARFSEAGLRARLLVVRKVAQILEDQGRLGPYRSAVDDALDVIADAAGSHPDIERDVRGVASRYGNRGLRRAAHSARAGGRRLRGAVASHRPGGEATQAEGGPEVSFGMARAAELLSASAGPAQVTMVQRPTVSVVVPTYNRAHILPRALDSVLAQTFHDFEVLVVDDCSDDATAEVVAAYGDPRIRYFRQPHNQGVAAARNRAMRAARGEFIAFLDSDDQWLPDKLALQVQRLRALPDDVGLIYGGVEDDHGGGRVVERRPTARGDIHRQLLERNVLHGSSSVVVRRRVVATVGFFDEDIPAIEDYDYWLRISRFFQVDLVPDVVMRYHDPQDEERKSLDIEANREARRWLYRRHGPDMRRAGVAHRFLAEGARRHLDPSLPDRRGAFRLGLQAWWLAPRSLVPHRVLVRALAPEPLVALWVQLRHRPRARGAPRVLLHSPTSPTEGGGVQAVFASLAHGLRALGHEVSESWGATGDAANPEHLTVRLELPELRRRAVLRSGVATIRSSLSLVRTLLRERPDVVNVHYVRPEIAHFLLWRPVLRYKLVLTVHGSDVWFPTGKLTLRLLPALIRRADAVVAVTTPLAERVRSAAELEGPLLRVIPNGVDVAFWQPTGADERQLVHGGRTLITVGRLEPVKGHDVLLDALPLIRQRVPDVALVIVGGGDSRRALEERAARLGVADRVTFTGRLEPAEVRQELHAADVFVLPSRSEGMPLAILEAMAAGLPVVASAVGGVPEVVTSAGVLVPAEDPDALARAVADLLCDPAGAGDLATAAIDRAACYSSRAVAESYGRLFRELHQRRSLPEASRADG